LAFNLSFAFAFQASNFGVSQQIMPRVNKVFNEFNPDTALYLFVSGVSVA